MFVNLDVLGSLIKSQISGAVGWAYYIKDLGRPEMLRRTDYGGFAVHPQDYAAYAGMSVDSLQKYWGLGVPQTQVKPQELYSTSKTITAAAAVKLIMSRLPKGLDSLISPFLPADWDHSRVDEAGNKVDNGVDSITFRHLLTHRTHFQEYELSEDGKTKIKIVAKGPKETGTGRIACRYDFMKDSIKEGINVSNLTTDYEWYQNINFGLFRVLIPYILDAGKNHLEKVRTNWPGLFDMFLGVTYANYVKEQILSPANLGDVTVYTPTSGEPATRYYDKELVSSPELPDPYRFVAGTDWKLSAAQYATFLTALISETLNPPGVSLWQKMLGESLGLTYEYGSTPFGAIAGKGGDGELPGSVHSGWIYVPGPVFGKGVVAVALINSDLPGVEFRNTDLPGRLALCYDTAIALSNTPWFD